MSSVAGTGRSGTTSAGTASRSSPSSTTNASTSAGHAFSSSPMEVLRSSSINVHEFYSPGSFDDDEAFIRAQRAAFDAIDNAALAMALKASQREAEQDRITRSRKSVEPSISAPPTKYSLVPLSQLGASRRHARSPSISSTSSLESTWSSSSSSGCKSGSTSASTTPPSSTFSSPPRTPLVSTKSLFPTPSSSASASASATIARRSSSPATTPHVYPDTPTQTKVALPRPKTAVITPSTSTKSVSASKSVASKASAHSSSLPIPASTSSRYPQHASAYLISPASNSSGSAPRSSSSSSSTSRPASIKPKAPSSSSNLSSTSSSSSASSKSASSAIKAPVPVPSIPPAPQSPPEPPANRDTATPPTKSQPIPIARAPKSLPAAASAPVSCSAPLTASPPAARPSSSARSHSTTVVPPLKKAVSAPAATTAENEPAKQTEKLVPVAADVETSLVEASKSGPKTPAPTPRSPRLCEDTVECLKCSNPLEIQRRAGTPTSSADPESPSFLRTLHVICSKCSASHCKGCLERLDRETGTRICPKDCTGGKDCGIKKCCPLVCLAAIAECLDGLNVELLGPPVDDKKVLPMQAAGQSRLHAALSKADRSSRGAMDRTIGVLEKWLAILSEATSPRVSTSPSEAATDADSPDGPAPPPGPASTSPPLIQTRLQTLIATSTLPAALHFFLSNESASDWIKFSELYTGILALLRRIAEAGAGPALSAPQPRSSSVLCAVGPDQASEGRWTSVWDLVCGLEEKTQAQLMLHASTIKFGATKERVHGLCDGILWLILHDLTH